MIGHVNVIQTNVLGEKGALLNIGNCRKGAFYPILPILSCSTKTEWKSKTKSDDRLIIFTTKIKGRDYKKNFGTLLLFKINEMEARLFSLRKFWTSWYIHVSGNIWRKIPENCKVGAMKLLRRKPGREKTFLLKKFETKHISVSKTRWSFHQSTCILSCFSFLYPNIHTQSAY